VRKVLDTSPYVKVLVLAHTQELVAQNYEKLSLLCGEQITGVYCAGLNRKDIYKQIIAGSIDSVINKVEMFGRVDIVLIDEAHRVSLAKTSNYRKLEETLRLLNPNVKFIGMTATPFRQGQGYITDGDDRLFTDFAIDLTTPECFNRFISEGYLCPLISKTMGTEYDVSGVKMSMGDFHTGDLEVAVNQDALTESAIEEIIYYGKDRASWIVFTVGIEHTKSVSRMLQERGVRTTYVHSSSKKHKFSKRDREQNIKDFKDGKYQCMVNGSILTTGFDHPPLDLIAIIRHTTSVGLWRQMLGRGLRNVYADGYDLTTQEGRLSAIASGPKQNCLILDFAKNTHRLGPVNSKIKINKKGKGGGEAPVKDCPSCNSIVFASARVCPDCGMEFKFESKLQMQASTDEIITGDLPQVEVVKIATITISSYVTKAGDNCFKVNYHCGENGIGGLYSDFVNLENPHPLAKRESRKWWQARSTNDVPNTVEEAIDRSEELDHPKYLRVWVNKTPYPKILDYCFDNSAFGEINDSMDAEEGPQILCDELDRKRSHAKFVEDLRSEDPTIFDDDIPF